MGLIKKFAIIACVLLVIAGAGTVFWLTTSFPVKTGPLVVNGPSTPVEIYRDETAIPYIYAKTDADAYFGLGFVHAQDRFWQMELMRRFGAGRLSEILGPSTLGTDKWMRTLGLYAKAEEQLELMPDAVKAALDAYANGVNQWLETKTGLGAIELAAFQYEPDAWKPADSIVWIKAMASRLSGNFRKEILRTRLINEVGSDGMDAFLPDYPRQGPMTTAGISNPNIVNHLAQLGRHIPEDAGQAIGASNQWVVSPKSSATGAALLANDPHLGFGAPVQWYLAYLETPTLKMTGATAPGVPFHVFGHNEKIAWGITLTQADQVDLFLEKQQDGKESHYLAPSGPMPFDTQTVRLNIKDAPSQELTIRKTHHGPIISDLIPDLRPADDARMVVALSAVYLQPDDKTFLALYALNRAKNWSEFRNALGFVRSPALNVSYADVSGNIGFQVGGAIPNRPIGDGSLPVEGWTGSHDWLGTIDTDQLPSLYNPPSGQIINANNPVGDIRKKPFISRDWANPYRASRITNLLTSETTQDMAKMQALQLDTHSLVAETLLPLLLEIAKTSDVKEQEILRQLGSWDGDMDRNLAEPLIFSYWLREINRAMYFDELTALGPRILDLRPRFIETVLRQKKTWCDNTKTPKTETCQDIISNSLSNALTELSRTFGADIEGWQWGKAHETLFAHSVFRHVPYLNALTDLRIANSGSNDTVNRGTTRVRNDKAPFEHIHGPGYRAIYDLGNLSKSKYQIATGQSGNFLSKHYRDQLQNWRDGRYVTIDGTKDSVISRSDRPMVLTPPKRLCTTLDTC